MLIGSLLGYGVGMLSRANVIFARSFGQSDQADQAFGANLLGILVGGLCEYSALVIGCPVLLLVATGFYVVATALRNRSAAAA